MLRGLALAGGVVLCIYKGPTSSSTKGTRLSPGSQVHTCLQHVMFIANTFVAHLRHPLLILLYIVC